MLIQSTCILWRRLKTVSARESCWGYCLRMGDWSQGYKPYGPYITGRTAMSIFSARSQWVVPLSTILFEIFTGRISRCSRVEESVQSGRIVSQLFADDVLLVTPSDRDLQHALLQKENVVGERESGIPC